MKITIPETTITIPNVLAIRCWKWGLLALLVLVLALFSVGPAGKTAADPTTGDPEVYLDVKGGGTCDVSPKPTKCDVPIGGSFTLSAGVNTWPVGGYRGFDTSIIFGSSLTYKPTADPADEVVWPDSSGAPIRVIYPTKVSHEEEVAGLSTHKGNIIEITLNCPTTPGAYGVSSIGFLEDSSHNPLAFVNVALTINCQAPEINITKQSVVVPLPGACFQVNDEFNTTELFQVCDNDWQGAESHPYCDLDGTLECEDSDPARGSIRVSVLAGQYSVSESKAPVNHNPDASKQPCDNKAGKCQLTFENTSKTIPWHPWDITGPEGVADGLVRVNDILAVVNNYFNDKPIE